MNPFESESYAISKNREYKMSINENSDCAVPGEKFFEFLKEIGLSDEEISDLQTAFARLVDSFTKLFLTKQSGA